MKNIKVTVTNNFRDKYSGIMRKKGDILTISEERYRELKRNGDYIKAEVKETASIEKK